MGPVTAQCSPTGSGTAAARAGAGIWLWFTISGFNTVLYEGSELTMNDTGIFSKTGSFAPLNVGFPTATLNNNLVTSTFNAVPNTPLYIDMQMTVGTSNASGNSTTGSDFFSGTNGFSFPVGVPVFNLPPGYTVDIPELNIFNNLWQTAAPPDISVSPLSVNFGSVTVGSPSTALVTATNTGGGNLMLHSAALGAGSSALSILSIKRAGVNVSLPVTLSNNQTVDFELLFNPAVAGAAARTLIITSNDADEDTVTVQLSGVGLQAPVPPSQQIASILTFFDDSVVAGTLLGDGAGNSAPGRLKALRNMIEAAGDFIAAGDLVQACTQLSDVLSRIDGNPRPPDFAIGPALPELRTRVCDLRSALGCS